MTFETFITYSIQGFLANLLQKQVVNNRHANHKKVVDSSISRDINQSKTQVAKWSE